MDNDTEEKPLSNSGQFNPSINNTLRRSDSVEQRLLATEVKRPHKNALALSFADGEDVLKNSEDN